MDFLPFEIYSAPFPIDKYGLILEIPEYCTQSELEKIEEHCYTNMPHYRESIPLDAYPNTSIFDIPVPYKSQCIFDNRWKVFEWFKNHHQDALYRFESSTRESRMSLRDRVQGSPVGMKDYPPHNDGGKLLTCIFPLRPVSSNSTMFTGWKNKHSDVFIPWKVNHAYLFCSSQYSYHWYSGDKNHDRWVYNFNIFDLDELNKSTQYNTTTGYPEGFKGWTIKPS